ncbi:MAG: hypothetical protein QM302_07325 [Acidobacteriota bacterium]|nr:hypothetical protein [Acidobacteriota bacterium]
MEEQYTGIALAKQGNKGICVIHYIDAHRKQLRNDRYTEGDPFVALVNARMLPDFMLAYELVRGEDDDTVFTEDFFVTDPEPVTYEDVPEICALFGDESPTRTTVAKTRDAIDVWSIENISDESGDPFDAPDGSQHRNYMCTPLSVMLEALDDLRRHATLLAWLVGKVDFATAHGLPVGDKQARFKTLYKARDAQLLGYYKELGDAPANTYNFMNAGGAAVEQMHLYSRTQEGYMVIERDVTSYVSAAFAIMMSDRTCKLDRDMHPCTSSNTLLSAMWVRFAEGLDQEDGPGSLGICRRCGKFFERKRNTRLYCSESCRVMATRDRANGIEGKPEPEPTSISDRRAKKRAELAADYAESDARLRELGLTVDDDGNIVF